MLCCVVLCRDVLCKKGTLMTRMKCEEVSLLEYFKQKFVCRAGGAM